MKILCVTPTYGRPALVASLVAHFEAQTHPHEDRRLLILDDLGQLSGEGPGWRVVSTPDRFPMLIEKYRRLYALACDWWPEWEAMAIWEDDDLYGPECLATHAQALQRRPWSKPSQIYCTYNVDVLAGQQPFLETRQSCAGRFFASVALRRELLEATGGFRPTPAKDFDLQHLAIWNRLGGDPADPCDFGAPQYCYGWGRSNHLSGGMGSDDWYTAAQPMDATPDIVLTPKLDEFARRAVGQIWRKPADAWELRRRKSRCQGCNRVPHCPTHVGPDDRFWAWWICPLQRWQKEVNGLNAEEIAAWMKRDPSAGRPTLPAVTRRNLLFHCYPARSNELWRWHVKRLVEASALWTGAVHVCVATGEHTWPFKDIRTEFPDAWDVFEQANHTRLREVASFERLLACVESTSAHEATFYTHSKGNATGGNSVGAEYWTRTAYHMLLDNAPRLARVLRHWDAFGVNKLILPEEGGTPFPSGIRVSDWFFAGTQFWFRHDAVFSQQWRKIPDDTYGAEAWIGTVVRKEHAWCDYQVWPDSHAIHVDPYNPYGYSDEVIQ